MLTLIFYVGESAYGIDCQYVVEIIPYVSIERKHRVHDFIAGVVKFYGQPVPVIDFCRIMSNTSCLSCFHTRIAILSLAGEGNEMLSLGLIGEKMVEVVDIDQSKISEKSFAFGKAPYLGEVVDIQGRTIQLIKARELFQAMQGDM
jgi:chemotaxis signal transduction protein